ncbi:4-hydroxy-tetrahydrodipicolinate synthase [Clostridium sp. HMP27]|uniref:4-hydroxy-tetrahydrodipicolinate synthase n=1 Tax=Clostridium sp. HMP27 TaxID=1487921 RepID=UPI00052D94A9|nr:4-hydroxy-tetrahydrodipicolinate synthase [Clostridium sp. HMP27]KGK88928.1 4-hydroxy-tetrahydrodipicolinate synthase [Clostridium sp. HMP27]
MSIFKGSGVAIITPFDENGIDFNKLEELIEWHIANSTDAIIICGTTGEASTMSETERKETIKFTVDKVHGRIPVIAGTGSNNTKGTIEYSKWAESIGVDGLLLITPYYNKTTQKGLLEHFKEIDKNINTPIVLYNVPARTGMNIAPSTLVKICAECRNVVAIKEASGNISQIAEIKALLRDKIDIYSGNDDQIIPIMSLGGIGVISVVANILPKEMHNMCNYYMEGKLEEALKIQLDTLALTNALFIETNPIPVKTAMNVLGLSVGDLRLPLCSMSENNLAVLKNELKAYGLLK